MLTRERMLISIPAIATLIAACAAPGGGATTAPVTAAPPTAAPTAAATEPPMSAPPASAASGKLELELGDEDSLGSFVVGENGMTLYLFTPDATAPGKSVCNGDCAASWPPLTVEAAGDVVAGSGVTGALGTVTRDDGTTQVTLAGSPLYYFAGDKAAGDVNGQGLNDKWYVVDASGKAIQKAASGDPDY